MTYKEAMTEALKREGVSQDEIEYRIQLADSMPGSGLDETVPPERLEVYMELLVTTYRTAQTLDPFHRLLLAGSIVHHLQKKHIEKN